VLIAQGGEHVGAGHGAPARSRCEFLGIVRDVEIDDDQAGGAAGDPDVVRRPAPPGADASRFCGGVIVPVAAQRGPLPTGNAGEHVPATFGQGQRGPQQGPDRYDLCQGVGHGDPSLRAMGDWKMGVKR
jgi:hypothetical protein